MTQDSPAVVCHKTVPRASVPEGESSLPYSHGPSATRLGGEKDQRQGEVPGKPWQLKMPSSEGMGTGQTHQAAARSPHPPQQLPSPEPGETQPWASGQALLPPRS